MSFALQCTLRVHFAYCTPCKTTPQRREGLKQLQTTLLRRQTAWRDDVERRPRLTAVPGSHLPPPPDVAPQVSGWRGEEERRTPPCAALALTLSAVIVAF